jgi:predicted O-methyltransferase YrrM
LNHFKRISGVEQNFFLLGKVSQYTGLNLLEYINELMDTELLITQFEEIVKNEPHFETKKFEGIFDFRFFRIILYCLIRSIKPDHVVETGIMHGLSSGFILAALEKNRMGILHSIDAPSYFENGPINQDGYNETLPPGKAPGWIVPNSFRKSWDLKLGKSRELLPKLSEKVKSWDLFCHDSEHTYENMSFELNVAWNVLRDGGILICDNIEANNSFQDFCKKVKRNPLLLEAPNRTFSNLIRFGLIIK